MKITKSVVLVFVVGVLGSIISGCRNSENKVKSVILDEGESSAAILEDGSLYIWGYSGDNQPVKIMNNVVSISSGCEHYAAITTDGNLYTWGDNSYGQLGNGKTKDSDTPIKVKFPKK